MEGDFRRPQRRPDGFVGGRPQPQSSQRPFPVTDLRTPAQPKPPVNQPASPQLTTRPMPQNQPAPMHAPVAPAAPQPAAHAAPTTAELIARHERETTPATNTKRNLILAVAGLVAVVAGALLLAHRAPAKSSGLLPSSITASQITIPIYYPKGLPAGFKVSGYKVVKQDVLNYVVTNSNNDSFYVNIQPAPAGYDFNAFNKRFTTPYSLTTTIGTATTGIINNQLICSIVTSKSWLMINTTAIKDTADMATIAKSLKPVAL